MKQDTQTSQIGCGLSTAIAVLLIIATAIAKLI